MTAVAERPQSSCMDDRRRTLVLETSLRTSARAHASRPLVDLADVG